MAIDSNTFALILTHIFTFIIGSILNFVFIRRPRLISYLSHVSVFTTKAKDTSKKILVFTHQLVIRNVGSKTATNVRVGHQVLPDFHIYPKRQYDIAELPDGGKEIVFPNLVKREEISISYLYFPPLTVNQINTHVKSDEGFAKSVTVLLTRVIPNWGKVLTFILLLLGSATLIYLIYTLIKWLIKIS